MSTTFGEPVSLDLGGVCFDLGAVKIDGCPLVSLVMDDGSGCARVTLSPSSAERLADTLRQLAAVRL